jgi:Tfp pilus assembly protein PilX
MKTKTLRNSPVAPCDCRIGSEDGFVLVLSLMVLVVLTLLGISATDTSVIEVQIAGNDNVAKMLFYNAESAAHEAAQRLQNERDENKLKAARTPFVWLSEEAKTHDLLAGGDTNWSNTLSEQSKISNANALNITTQLAALDYGVVKGEQGTSLKMTETRVYFYKLLGRAVRNSREKIVEIGYKKRY